MSRLIYPYSSSHMITNSTLSKSPIPWKRLSLCHSESYLVMSQSLLVFPSFQNILCFESISLILWCFCVHISWRNPFFYNFSHFNPFWVSFVIPGDFSLICLNRELVCCIDCLMVSTCLMVSGLNESLIILPSMSHASMVRGFLLGLVWISPLLI